jgi:hypothetical protein
MRPVGSAHPSAARCHCGLLPCAPSSSNSGSQCTGTYSRNIADLYDNRDVLLYLAASCPEDLDLPSGRATPALCFHGKGGWWRDLPTTGGERLWYSVGPEREWTNGASKNQLNELPRNFWTLFLIDNVDSWISLHYISPITQLGRINEQSLPFKKGQKPSQFSPASYRVRLMRSADACVLTWQSTLVPLLGCGRVLLYTVQPSDDWSLLLSWREERANADVSSDTVDSFLLRRRCSG